MFLIYNTWCILFIVAIKNLYIWYKVAIKNILDLLVFPEVALDAIGIHWTELDFIKV